MSVRLGFSVHTGWAVMVAVSGSPRDPRIRHRARLEMIRDELPAETRFAYHHARDLGGRAPTFVKSMTALAHKRAVAALDAALDGLGEIAGAGIVVGAKPLDAPLADILANHSLIHTAEGELFRDAIRRACERRDLAVTAVPARELPIAGAARLGVTLAALPARLAAIGRAAGRPWAKDQKDALLAALCA